MRGLRVVATLLVLALFSAAAWAQDLVLPDYEEWTDKAASAERVISSGRASETALESLRSQIAEWREEFLAAQSVNATRIETLQSQIAALGPVPDEGGSEPIEITKRRGELSAQLTELRAPVLRAEEAHTQSNGLILEIDRIIRERQTDELLELGPSPLNPVQWGSALEELSQTLSRTWRELMTNAASPIKQAETRRNLPMILTLLAVAIMLLARGQTWARLAVDLLRGRARRGTGVFSFIASLGQILLPLLGIFALTEAFAATGFEGPRWSLLLDQVPLWAALLLGIRWLADQSFHPNDDVATLHLAPVDRRKARAFANILGVLYVAKDVVETLGELDTYSAATVSTLQFPVLVLSGLMLFRLGRVRNEALNQEVAGDDAPDAQMFRLRFARLMGRAAMIVGVVSPVLAAIGYYRVGEALVYPAIATLSLVGLVLVLQRFINDLYALITGRRSETQDSLLPVLAGFVLSILSLPVLALIWGARIADLTEIWTRFREGFQFGDTRISPTDFLVVAVVFFVGYMLTRLLQGALRTSVLPKTKIDMGGQNAIVSGVGYVGIFSAALVAITAGGLDLSSLAIVAGALSVGIGFGLQNIVSNFVSGIILLIERPISEGDWIEVGGTHGIVKDISVRSTRIETFDKYDVIIPNADFVSGTVSNYTRGNSLGRVIISVGVAYGNDTRKVERILLNIAREHPVIMMNPAPYVFFKGFGADSLDFEIRAILHDVGQGLSVRTEIHHQIVERFADEGIEIPFAQRDIWIRNPETLVPAAPSMQDTDETVPDPSNGSGPANADHSEDTTSKDKT